MTSASSTVWPPGKYRSRVRPICSSGLNALSCLCSRGQIRSVTSGASKFLPRELAYFFSIISRTSSTKSSSLVATSVADACGRFTQIFRTTIVVLCEVSTVAIVGLLGLSCLPNGYAKQVAVLKYSIRTMKQCCILVWFLGCCLSWDIQSLSSKWSR